MDDDEAPALIALDPDEHHARYVGRAPDGRQFFLSTPFVPGQNDYLALYVFDEDGALLQATVEDLGPRHSLEECELAKRQAKLLATLGEVTTEGIEVAPFSIERSGVRFGFILHQPEEEGDDYSVTVEPGSYMCFWPPWDSGEYDT